MIPGNYKVGVCIPGYRVVKHRSCRLIKINTFRNRSRQELSGIGPVWDGSNWKESAFSGIEIVIRFANSRNLAYYEAASIQNAAQFEVWFGACDSMHDPFDRLNLVQTGVTLDERSERSQNSFSATLNLSQLDNQAILIAAELSEHCGRADSKNQGLAIEHQGLDLFGRKIKNLFF